MGSRDAEQQLVSRIVAGEREAFRLVLRDHRRLVAHIVRRMVRNAEDRRDLEQEIFLRVYENLPRFQGESRLSTWIARIAYNTCLHHLEKKRVALYGDLFGEEASVDDWPSPGRSPAQAAHARLQSVRIAEEIDRLPLPYGLVLTLYHFNDLGYAEIADILQMPEGTVKSYLFRARRLLRGRLENLQVVDERCA